MHDNENLTLKYGIKTYRKNTLDTQLAIQQFFCLIVCHVELKMQEKTT